MKVFFLISIYLVCSACDKHSRPDSANQSKNLKEPLIKANKVIASDNAREIERYIERHKQTMEKTGSGLRYFIIKRGNGKRVVSGCTVKIGYRSSLLNGMTCYEGEKELTAGRGDIESGVEEGILLLHEGDSAEFILPPHLAYGITGDNKRIPSNAVLVYDIMVKTVIR